MSEVLSQFLSSRCEVEPGRTVPFLRLLKAVREATGTNPSRDELLVSVAGHPALRLQHVGGRVIVVGASLRAA